MDLKREAVVRKRRWMSWRPADLLPLATLVLGCAALPMLRGPTSILAAYAVLFVLYAWAVSASRPVPRLVIWLTGVACQLVLIGHAPVLSDDLFRYVWEGRVWLYGGNPFVEPPASETLRALRDSAIFPNINHAEVPTIYPPAAQGLFVLNAILGGGTTMLRWIFVVVEFCLLGWASRLLNLSNRQLSRLVFSPLLIVETAWSGHIDAIAVALLVAAYAVWERRGSSAGLFFGLSIATKFLGVIGLVLVVLSPLRSRESRFDRLKLAVVSAAVVAVSYLPCLPNNPAEVVKGFQTYAASWRNNDGAFRLWDATAEWAFSKLGEADPGSGKVLVHLDGLDEWAVKVGATKTWNGQTLPNTTFAADQVSQFVAKVVGAATVVCALLFALWVLRDPWLGFGCVMLTLLFCAPTVHPWYVVWLLPFAARSRGGWADASLLFSGLVLLGYLSWWSTARGGPWFVPAWAALIEFGAIAIVALRSRPTYSLKLTNRI